MTLPDERTRSLLWAGSFLIDIARDERLPLPVRRRAVTIARHFPTIEDIEWMAASLSGSAFSLQLASPEDAMRNEKDDSFSPLRHSTRFRWPGED